MVKKIILMIAAVMMLAMGAQAQRGFRANLSLHGNFGEGVNDMSALKDIVTDANQSGDYSSIASYIPSFGIGLCGGYSGSFFLIDANIRLNYGMDFNTSSNNHQWDKIAFVSVGVRALKLGIVELEAKLGYGVSMTDFTLKELDSKIRASSMIMPLSATFWFGNTSSAHRRVGVSFEYMFTIANLHENKYEGFTDVASSVINELKVAPSSMNVALRYQF